MGPAMTVAGVLGNIVSVGVILAPMSTIWTILQKRSTEKFSPLPFAAMMLSCCLWLFYGSPLVKFGILLETINGFGVGMEFAFLIIFLVYANDRKTRIQVLMLITSVLLLVAMVVSLTLAFVHEKSRRRTVVGVVSAVLTMTMYFSPLYIMRMVIETNCTQFRLQRMVIKTSSPKYMPLLVSLMAFLNAGLWGAYGILGHDLYIMIPSFLGVGMALGQLVLCACYWRRSAEDDLDLELEHKLPREKIDNLTDSELVQVPGHASAEKTSIWTDPEFGQSLGHVVGQKINGHTSPVSPQSPESDQEHVLKLYGVDRS